MNRLTVKVAILYLFLAVINISFFTIMIFENQMELIAENTGYKANELSGKIINTILKESGDSLRNNDFKTVSESLKGMIDNFTVFDESGTVIYKTDPAFEINKENMSYGLKSISNKEFLGGQYFTSIDRKNYMVSLYYPIVTQGEKDKVILISFVIKSINASLKNIYTQIGLMIILLTVFHIAFGFILNMIIVKPVMRLRKSSMEIASGNYSTRVKIGGRDELALLGETFNNMAGYVEKTIKQLKDQNDVMKMELDVAGDVQSGIYPNIDANDSFKVAIYHNPLEVVSGDFHDVIKLGDNKTGVLIADVSGHGVPAALITMRIKDVFKRLAPASRSPKELLKRLNNEFGDLMERFSCFFTAFYLVFDDKSLVYSNAGHCRMYLLRKNTGKLEELGGDGFIVGVSTEMGSLYEDRKAEIYSGDRIILFTDGIIEAKNSKNEQYESKRLVDTILQYASSGVNELLDGVKSDLEQFRGDAEQRDDETLMIVEIN